MKKQYNLAECQWVLRGVSPHAWRQEIPRELGRLQADEIATLSAKVPGSVQKALHHAGILPDWNQGLQSRECEWVEHRHWIFEAEIPAEWLNDLEAECHLSCRGLDHAGWIRLNGEIVGEFESAFIPYRFDLTGKVNAGRGNRLEIIFDTPPTYQGQMGYTAAFTSQKPRFYYTWDWMPRMVQIGVWDGVFLETTIGPDFKTLSISSGLDSLMVQGSSDADNLSVSIAVYDGPQEIAREDLPSGTSFETTLENLSVECWWPNGAGEQKLYTVRCELIDGSGVLHDVREEKIGFRSIEWRHCEDSPEGSDPWVCVVNGRPVFLQGVNWTPVLPNFADAEAAQYRRLLEQYRDMGCNMLRVWGGAGPERELFYDLCDQMGLLVWQEFPLCSSGKESLPPSDSFSMEMFSKAAENYIERLQHHPSLCLWCGGNELADRHGVPCGLNEPLLKRLHDLVRKKDPQRRFIATSPGGPSFCAEQENNGKGEHWDVHGPWKNPDGTLESWREYWEHDDALFRSEVGAAGASPAGLIRAYAGDRDPFPPCNENPLWRRTSWWTDRDVFCQQRGRDPVTLEEYVEWSQQWQADQLAVAAGSCKKRFPRCGGFLVWMGHDSFPCTANTSIIDFEHQPKPAFYSLRKMFRGD